MDLKAKIDSILDGCGGVTDEKLAAIMEVVPQEPHRPQRGSDVEAWIKARRDMYDSADIYDGVAYDALDNLLDEYREAADTGRPLGLTDG